MPLRWHRPLMLLCGALGVLALMCVIGLIANDRMLLGEPIWLKPLKFCVSFIAFGTVIAWMLPTLRAGGQGVRVGPIRIAVAGYGALMALLTWQALRGQPLPRPDAAELGGLGLIAIAVGRRGQAAQPVLRTSAPEVAVR
ncbi:hypothetical protein N5079_09940 [Planotetraspora sp. A-T 1434]|uniref:hypothetical protein n=1 Tax=Planotetraspora sp. A-T 1434 TaxID=2979219 RepID=UPI0021C05D04|nr:hypothetical protein [Planotetraspora sp. A-T 1434]MCT9930535.1 hypothetical protein [Planotetraspora sp. A-T 1434]